MLSARGHIFVCGAWVRVCVVFMVVGWSRGHASILQAGQPAL